MTATRDEFRAGMARVAAAVNIITTDGPAGKTGFTATAMCSITDTPPTLLVCFNRSSERNLFFKQNQILCVNTLSADQEELASVFAGATKCTPLERFEHGHWGTLETGAPVLAEALASFDCRIAEIQEVGTHSLFFCEVEAVQLGGEGQGLGYLSRAFHRVGAALA